MNFPAATRIGTELAAIIPLPSPNIFWRVKHPYYWPNAAAGYRLAEVCNHSFPRR